MTELIKFLIISSTVLIFCLLLRAEASISSSSFLRRTERGPQLVETSSQLFQSMRSRFKRASPPPKPKVKQFDLVNDTTHNQALIHWSGENSKVVFILTRKKSTSMRNEITESTLWRSVDYGGEYTKMTNSEKFDANTTLKSYFVCPTDKHKVIFVDTYLKSKRIWISIDEGETYEAVNVPFSVEKIEFHPERSEYLLGYDKLYRTLWCSKNFGKDWTKLHNEVTSERYYWYVKGVDKGENADSIVHFEYRNVYLIPKRIYEVKSCHIPDCRPTSFQKEFDALQNIDMDSLVVQDDYVFVQKSGAANKLYVSYKRGPFGKARFPFYAGNAQSHFHVVSSDGKCVVIGVNHMNGLTHLFFSNLEGDIYTQSLSNVRYYNRKTADKKVYTIDIHEVQGIIGTYLCNVHKSDGNNITKISWDNGRSWSDITEVADLNGRQMSDSCANCQLNLHLSMDQTKSGYYMPSTITKKTIPGLIIAHGTYGTTVQDNPSQAMVLTSNDNGKTWTAELQKRHLVVVADHGAIIVAIEMIFLRPVKQLKFSKDYGKTWNPYIFTSENVNVDGILTEPGESTYHLTLFGHKTYTDSWRIFRLDMSPLFSRACVYPADFENITYPTQVQDGSCHLGVVQNAERMKKNSDCLIASDYKRRTSKKNCDCTQQDYECDLGYKATGKECVKERDINNAIDLILGSEYLPIEREGKCDKHDKKNVSSGFRKIPGDSCMNERYDLLWQIVDCGTPGPTLAPVTSPSPSKLQLQLVNETYFAKMGQNLMFSIEGAENEVMWHVVRPVDVISKPKVVTYKRKPSDNLTLIPVAPGTYSVQVSIQRELSNMIQVKFWYPIEKIYLYYPPVVAKNKKYNATAWLATTYGLRGNKTLLGDVTYVWDTETEDTQYQSNINTLSGLSHTKTDPVQIKVTAENEVSVKSTSGKVEVKDFVETLVLNLHVEPEWRSEDFSTDTWLEEFKKELKYILYTQTIKDIMHEYKLFNELNTFLYIPPASPLQAYIYVAPLESGDVKDHLLKATIAMERAIQAQKVKILLASDHTVTVKGQYIIDHDGNIAVLPSTQKSSSNGAVIAIAVIIIIAVIVVVFFVLRKVSRRMRFDRYLNFGRLRRSSGGASHIVRSQDRAHIVDEEFIDDDLDTMEGIGSQDATLQFQG